MDEITLIYRLPGQVNTYQLSGHESQRALNTRQFVLAPFVGEVAYYNLSAETQTLIIPVPTQSGVQKAQISFPTYVGNLIGEVNSGIFEKSVAARSQFINGQPLTYFQVLRIYLVLTPKRFAICFPRSNGECGWGPLLNSYYARKVPAPRA